MKQYMKPIVISEQVFEKAALGCEDYMYYAKDYEGCREDYLGRGKTNTPCADALS